MENLTPLSASMAVGVVLCGCVMVFLLASERLEPPRLSLERLALVLLWLAVAWLLWLSDYPAAWRLPEIVEYLAEVTFSLFRILLVTATGAVLFGSVVALIFLTRPKRR